MQSGDDDAMKANERKYGMKWVDFGASRYDLLY
jgi:hypothetical protein